MNTPVRPIPALEYEIFQQKFVRIDEVNENNRKVETCNGQESSSENLIYQQYALLDQVLYTGQSVSFYRRNSSSDSGRRGDLLIYPSGQ